MDDLSDEARAQPLFVYGSLRDEAVMRSLLGAEMETVRVTAARLEGCRAVRPVGQGVSEPSLASDPRASVAGATLHGLSRSALDRLRAYAGRGWRLAAADVVSGAGGAAALTFQAASPPGPDWPDWSAAEWEAADAIWVRRAAGALGALFDAETIRAGGAPRLQALTALADLWPELLGAAAAERGEPGPVRRGLGPAFGREAVVELERTRPYEVHYKVDRVLLRHRLLGAPDRMGDVVERAVFRAGDAVAVLPYDPLRDRVLLIEQFRAGPWAAGDPEPWLVEVVAGRVDAPGDENGEDPQRATARRESVEEAGVALGRLERVFEGYASPGATDERLAYFVGEARLPSEQAEVALCGVHGLDEEGEDIRAFTLLLDDALSAVAAGEIRNGPAALSLLWLARHRARLQALWAAPGPFEEGRPEGVSTR